MRDTDPQFTFADLEFMNQGVRMDPVLAGISDFLDAHQELIETIRRQLRHGLKKPQTGRRGLTPMQVLCSLILMRIKNWDYRELAERIADGYILRKFTRFYSSHVPQHHAFNRAFNRLTPATLEAVNDLIIQAAVAAGVEDGAKLRPDTTVVQVAIHWPTDATLLWDAVRVISRSVDYLGEILPEAVSGFPNRTRIARRRMQKLQRMTSTQRQHQQVPAYRDLISATEEVVQKARHVVEVAKTQQRSDVMDRLAADALQTQIIDFCKLADRAIDQARRRVLNQEQVPGNEKLYSIFEPHTDLIKRGKSQTPVEFGHKVFLAESGNGLITQYRVLDGNPNDETHVEPTLKRHFVVFDVLDTFATDRGFQSTRNWELCEQAHIACTSMPQCGGIKTSERQAFEKTPAFKQAQRFRAGIEGTISVLFRGRGMKRCLARGREHFELLIGAAVITNNLMRFARLLLLQKPKKRAA